MAGAFRAGGDKVDFRVLPASGSEGHWLAETETGVKSRGSGTGSRAEDAGANTAKGDDGSR